MDKSLEGYRPFTDEEAEKFELLSLKVQVQKERQLRISAEMAKLRLELKSVGDALGIAASDFDRFLKSVGIETIDDYKTENGKTYVRVKFRKLPDENGTVHEATKEESLK